MCLCFLGHVILRINKFILVFKFEIELLWNSRNTGVHSVGFNVHIPLGRKHNGEWDVKVNLDRVINHRPGAIRHRIRQIACLRTRNHLRFTESTETHNGMHRTVFLHILQLALCIVSKLTKYRDGIGDCSHEEFIHLLNFISRDGTKVRAAGESEDGDDLSPWEIDIDISRRPLLTYRSNVEVLQE